jgi:hypothetical protein
MPRAKNHLVINRDIFGEREQIDFLLVLSADEVVVRLSRNGQNRRTVELGIVEAVQPHESPRVPTWPGIHRVALCISHSRTP